MFPNVVTSYYNTRRLNHTIAILTILSTDLFFFFFLWETLRTLIKENMSGMFSVSPKISANLCLIYCKSTRAELSFFFFSV